MSQNESNAGNPYAPGTVVETSTAINPQQTYKGLRRLPYFGYGLLAGLIIEFLEQAIFYTVGVGAATFGLGLLLGFLSFVVQVWIIALRLRNLGYSEWWCLGMLVPILNILIYFRCIACPEGYAHHKTLDTAGKIIAGIFLSLIVLAVLAIVLAAITP